MEKLIQYGTKESLYDGPFNGKFEITTDILHISVNENEGFLQSGDFKWHFVQPEEILDVHVTQKSKDKNSADCFVFELKYKNGSENWYIYPDLPFLCTECHPDGRIFTLTSPHIQLTTVELADVTDDNDSLVKESVHQYYKSHKARGNMFLIEDYLQNSGLLIVKHSPCPDSAVRRAPDGDLCLNKNGQAVLNGCGYGAAYGVGDPKELFDLYKKLYTNICDLPKMNFIMSNTWGDRSKDRAIKEDFVLRELDAAHHLGVDIVQLDDGWQTGSVEELKNKGLVLEGFWDCSKDFWTLDPRKFPNGIDTILKKASELNIEMGFWFAPDSTNDFVNWSKDAEIIGELAKSHGAHHIKLDGAMIRSEECEKNYFSLLEAISKLCDRKLRFNLDITYGKRLGYFCGIEYGTLFVENRYTDWKNYYPHRTLRNLWQLSRYLPASRFQFEVLNLRRNADLYGDDPLAPASYDIDWCFASVMASNPLIWMEMQNLSAEDTKALRKIIGIYRDHRAFMAEMPVHPIGDMPNGVCWSGFHFIGESNGYITVFRGITNEDTHTFSIPVSAGKYTVLHSNTDTDVCETDDGFKVTLGKKRGYAFIKYDK